jgi:serine/threonine protein kinase
VTTLPEFLSDFLRDRYALERELGRGGMATVYLAHDRRHERPVALKVLRPDLAVLGAERFLREIHIAARMQHPNILTLIDSGEVPDPERRDRGSVAHGPFTSRSNRVLPRSGAKAGSIRSQPGER